MMRSCLFNVMQLQEVASLNRKGVAKLAACDTREALHFFQRALQSLHEIQTSLPLSLRSAKDDSHSECPSLSLPQIRSSAVIPHLRSDNFFVYDQALIVCPAQQAVISPRHLTFYSAAIAFNMGLSFHLKANLRTHKTSSSSSFKKAAICYKQALVDINTNSNLNTNASQPNNGDTNMMQLLAMNNQCQVNYLLGNINEVKGGLELIRKLSPTAVLLRCNSPVFQKQGVIGELMLNVLVSNGNPVSAAPAA